MNNKKSTKRWLLYLLMAFCVMSGNHSCKEDVINPDDGGEEVDSTSIKNAAIDAWIYKYMEVYYYWEDKLPEYDTDEDSEPTEYFEELVYDDEDFWSYITDDYEALSGDLSGTPYSMGYAPAFYLYNNSENVLIVVKYVYPESPADKAGLKRGDIILTIDGEKLTPDNYYDLYSETSYTVALATLEENTLSLSGEEISMVAEVVEADPSVYHDVIEVDGTKIGYLVYTSFVTGDDDEYLASLDAIFDEFALAGVNDLVVDLRYNSGGAVTAAQYLASLIAPASVVQNNEVLIKNDFNDILTNHYTSEYGSDYFYYRFLENSHNLDLSTVYFLGTSKTASASELLISGLYPYMNSVLIGENTYGKYTGMFVISDSNEEVSYNYAMMPVVMKYQNADGYTDFVDGLTPDYAIEDDLINAVPFGDTTDSMLAQAISIITDNPVVALAQKSRKINIDLERIEPEQFEIRRNLFIEPLGFNESN